MNNLKNNNEQLTTAFTISIIAISMMVGLTVALSVMLNLDFSGSSPTRPTVRVTLLPFYVVSFVLGIIGLSMLKKVDRNIVYNRAYFILTRIFSIVSIIGSVLYVVTYGTLYLIVEFLYEALKSRNNRDQSYSSATSLIQMITPYLPY